MSKLLFCITNINWSLFWLNGFWLSQLSQISRIKYIPLYGEHYYITRVASDATFGLSLSRLEYLWVLHLFTGQLYYWMDESWNRYWLSTAKTYICLRFRNSAFYNSVYIHLMVEGDMHPKLTNSKRSGVGISKVFLGINCDLQQNY